MKKIFPLVIFCLLSVVINAQIITNSTINPGARGIWILVRDSTGSIPLPGAHVKLVSGKDTVNLITNENGSINYYKKVKDSIGLTVSSLGFNTISEKIKTAPSIYVSLSEKTYGITEVVIKGNMVAIVSRGDTTRYNAAAFKTMAGDNMAELFKKFPGMVFDGKNLSFKGAIVDRINIDDKRLFSNDVKLALENIRADDVISVDVYKEASDWDKLNNIKNGVKETVANVKTKSKLNSVFNRTVSIAGGQEIDKNNKGHYEKKYEVAGRAVFSQVGKSITANASYKNTAFNTLSKDLETGFKYAINKINKYQISTENKLINAKSHSENSSEQVYFPTVLYSSRTYLNNDIGNASNTTFTTSNNFSYTFKTKDNINVYLKLGYTGDKNDNFNSIFATLDGIPTNNLKLRSYNKKSTINTQGSITYRKQFGTQESSAFLTGVYLNSKTSFSLSQNDNNGWRVDTTASSTSKLYLTDSGNGWSRNYSTSFDLAIPIVKGFSVQLTDNLSYQDSKTERTAIDMLTGLIDTTNTQDYTFNYFKNDLSLSFNIYALQKKSTGHNKTSIQVGWERHEQLRNEYFPKDYSIPRTYNIPTVGLISFFNIGGQQVLARMNLKGDPMSIEELRAVIDDRNPTRLMVGNPDLKMPEILNITLEGGIPLDKKGTIVYLSIDGKNIQNYVTNKTEYFTKETFLPKYNYTVAKGATLTSKENVSESWNVNTSVTLSMRLLGSNIGLGVIYGYEKTPSYLGAVLYNLTANKYGLGFNFNTAFSSVFDVNINSTSMFIQSFNGLNRNDAFTENLTIEPKIQLGKRSKLILNGRYYHYGNRQLPNKEQNDFILNSSFSYRLDKKGNFNLWLSANDIFNQQRNIAINLGEDYTNTVRTLIPGRYWLIKADFKF